jgi:hypothetical protein
VEQLIDIFKALLTPVIAMVATYIAWQQWKTNRQKLKLEKYDRRLRVYEEVRKILSIIFRDPGKVSTDDLLRFRTSVSEADFLFGPGTEIPEYLDEIYKHGLNLWRLNQEYRDKPNGYDHKKVVDERHKECTWLTGQFNPAKEKFKKYLDISR